MEALQTVQTQGEGKHDKTILKDGIRETHKKITNLNKNLESNVPVKTPHG